MIQYNPSNKVILSFSIHIPRQISNYSKNLKIKSIRSDRRKRLLIHMNVILANMLVCVRNRSALVYTRNNSAFTKDKRYNPKGLTSRYLLEAIDTLETCGLLINNKAKPCIKKENRMPSWIQPTDEFLNKFGDKEAEIETVEESYINDDEYIILRDEYGRLMRYRDNRETRRMRDQLNLYNRVLKDFTFTDKDGGIITNHYVRIFKNTFEMGGRFYRGGILSIKNKGTHDRLKIKINNEMVTEIDYSNLHLMLLSYRHRLPYDPEEDLYMECLPESIQTSENRAIMKVCINILMNTLNKRSAISAMNNLIKDQKEPVPTQINTGSKIMKLIEKRIPKHVKVIFDNPYLGMHLQFMDSNIAYEVISWFLSREKPILVIHDSFIVRRSDQYELLDIMVEAVKIVTENPNCKISMDVEWFDKYYGCQRVVM